VTTSYALLQSRHCAGGPCSAGARRLADDADVAADRVTTCSASPMPDAIGRKAMPMRELIEPPWGVAQAMIRLSAVRQAGL
jgi:hypothetical protein